MNKNYQVLLLSSEFQPISYISWKKAMKLMIKEKAVAIGDVYHKIKTVSSEILIPKALKLLKIVRTFYKTHVNYSKKNVLVRDGFKCQYCGSDEKGLTIDHVLPRAKGGRTTFENVVAACSSCNIKKGDKHTYEVGMKLNKKPYHPTISEFTYLKMKTLGADNFLKELMT